MFGKILQLMLSIPVLQNIRLVFYFFDAICLLGIKKPKRNGKKEKVLIVFTHALGDAVMFYGAVPYLYMAYPKEKYEIYLTCHQAYRDLFAAAFQNVLAVDYRKASVNPVYRFRMLKKLRKIYFDIAVDPIGSEECGPNVFAMNAVCAGKKIGVLAEQDKRYQCPGWLRNKIYDVLIPEGKNIHKVRHYANVCSYLLGMGCQPQLARLPMADSVSLPDEFFIIYPSASAPVKRWPVERYADIAGKIYEETHWKMVVCGTDSDRKVTESFISMVPQIPIVNMLGKTTVMELIGIIGRAQIVVTNDTSVYHIAVATGRKTCVVSGCYVYNLFLDYLSDGYDQNVQIVAHKRKCMNCSNQCIYKVETVYPCLLEIPVDEVWDAIQRLI